jgi:hypothetical protein
MDSRPSVSFDGGLIAFQRNRNGKIEVFVYDRKTSTFLKRMCLQFPAASRCLRLADTHGLVYPLARCELHRALNDHRLV